MSSIENIDVQFIVAFLISVILFIVLITYISKNPKKNTKPLRIIFIVMFIIGMSIYCYFHFRVIVEVANGNITDKSLEWVKSENVSKFYYVSYVVMRSTVDVGMMFSGRTNSDIFYKLPESKTPEFTFGFSLLHMIAFFTASSAILLRFGSDFIIWIRKTKTKVSDLDLIFGINANSITFGKKIADREGSMLVYVDNIIIDDFESSIHKMGGITYSDKDALNANLSFLKDIRVKKNKTQLKLYALSCEYDKNIKYAKMMSENLEKLQIEPEQTELVLLGTNEKLGMSYQHNDEKYGYGKVISFDEYEIVSRLLIHEYPPCNFIKFDQNGRATEDIKVFIYGFGRIGHEILRKLIANGQFEGSNFSGIVYEPNMGQRTDYFSSQYPKIFPQYNVNIEPQSEKEVFTLLKENGSELKYVVEPQKKGVFTLLKENASELKYVVICLEDREAARNLAIRMVNILNDNGYQQNVYTCDIEGVRCYSANIKECKTHLIYDSEILYSEKPDMYAMELNHAYCLINGIKKDIKSNWRECNYFHRMSNRASVDYLIPLIHRIKEITGLNDLTSEQKENLAKCEHLRWCAFHYTFGYDVMEQEEFIQRIKSQQAEIREYGSSKIKPTQDTEKMKHVCLVSWDELDQISQTENSLTNGNKDYKENDRCNVDMVMKLVRDIN